MNRDISSAGAASRALAARNPLTFTCVHPLEESIRRLAAITDPPPRLFGAERRPSWQEAVDQPLVAAPQRPKGFVNDETVTLDWDKVRFEGRWASKLDVVTLEGVMVPHGVSRRVGPAVAVVVFAAVAAAGGPARYWLMGILAALFVIAMPLFVAYLGSARVAAEIELERLIGSAIGDPETYAAKWRRWRDE